MTGTLAEKILRSHLVDGKMQADEEIGVKIDRALLQDATGTMAILQFEALGIPKPKTEFAIIYVDHNILQTGFENADDHRFLQTFAAKHGIFFSKPGNGICHQVNLERFSVPGKILLGSDSHTPTAGGAGMLGIGAGGLDVAVAMAGSPFYIKMPEIIGVNLVGHLQPWVTGKDVILELLRRLTVKGGTGKIIEYFGPGAATLSTPERATITNMGAELGATSSLFPSDAVTKDFFIRQNREKEWSPLAADSNAVYSSIITIDLSTLEPLIATPGSPDNVKPVKDVEGTPIHQACIGSCVNSNYRDLMITAKVLKGKTIHPTVSLQINPGSKQVLQTILSEGAVYDLIAAGARLLENACNGCIGMGSSPASGTNSIRSFNRNWPGRSGTTEDSVYLASPETCVAAALNGKITDPRRLGEYPHIEWPKRFVIDDSMILPPSKAPNEITIARGPNIAPLPLRGPLEESITGEVLIKLGDDISTDAIVPAGAKVLPLRSNIPAISQFTFAYIDKDFVARAKAKKGGVIVGGTNYGQGSSREHAALAPMYLGVKAVLAKSFARIHRTNLINVGIVPLEFNQAADYDRIRLGSTVHIVNLLQTIRMGASVIKGEVDGASADFKLSLTPRLRDILEAGGLLNYAKNRS